MSNNTNDTTQLTQLCHDLRMELAHIDSKIAQLINEKKQIEKEINKNKKILYHTCNHTWALEPPQYQAHTSWYCIKCKNYK